MSNLDMTTEKDLVEKMRSSRQKSNTIFMQFTQARYRFPDSCFCFYEGEDGKYYSPRIKKFINKPSISFVLNGKSEVVKIWKKINSEQQYNAINKMFFIDKDMDNPIHDKDDDLYITPCYSIENFYSNKECFISILENEFFVTKICSDYFTCVEKFEKLFTEFNNLVKDFNVIVLLRTIKNNKISLQDIKTGKLVKININEVSKHEKYEEEILQLKTLLSVSEEEFLEGHRQLQGMGNPVDIYRGKNQLYFLVEFIKLLVSLHKKGEFFYEKRPSVNINLSGNVLSELSQHATEPSCLVSFLQNHN